MHNVPYDCPPILDDAQVIEFCTNGYLMLERVIPDEINRRTIAYLDGRAPSYEVTDILDEVWFVDGVLKNPLAAGAVRSLLGRNFKLPVIMSEHRGACPCPPGSWHRDAGSLDTRRLDYLQVFYHPQDTTPEMGPTEIVPCSHFMRTKNNFMAHYGQIRTSVTTACPAGSIVLTAYPLWHRRSRATASGTRHLLKYNCWRTAAPERDWIADPAFDFSTRHFGYGAYLRSVSTRADLMFERFRDAIAAAELFTWLCGLGEQYRFKGGQCWPVVPTVHGGDQQEGIPEALVAAAAREPLAARL